MSASQSSEGPTVGGDVARYFVVRPGPLKMVPGLFRLGHDFGNGEADRLHFQVDRTRRDYLAAKGMVLDQHPDRISLARDASARSLQHRALGWIRSTFFREHGTLLARPTVDWQGVRALSLELQEDFALVQKDEDGENRLVLLSVCFPSGWRPERLLGASFDAVHAPVPEFDAIARKSRQLVDGIIERGPYVRFVWTLSSDPRLDHHPDESPRDPWTSSSPGYLRIERQVTVPFVEQAGALFLIRTYLYAFSALSADERAVLRDAISALPASIAEYKGLPRVVSTVLQKLV